MAFNSIPAYSTTAGSNTDIGGVFIGEGWAAANINNSMRQLLAQLKTECALGANIASASTVDISTTHACRITGTTTITAFTITDGTTRFLTFADALTITHDATNLICPGGANITTAAGDCCIVEGIGTNRARIVNYMRASGLPVAPLTVDAGQCRLALSGSNIVLSPYNGNKILIDGSPKTIPSAGVSLAATGLTATTLYYIYAYMDSGTMTLEASTTSYATDSTSGVTIKSGDATRTLVGMARPVTGPAWVNSDSQALVVSWFNRRRRIATKSLSSNTLTTTSQEATSSRCEALIWADDSPTFSATGYESRGGAASTTNVMYIDGSAAQSVFLQNSNGSGAQAAGFAMRVPKGSVTEGYHTCGIGGATSTGTSTQSQVNTVITFEG